MAKKKTQVEIDKEIRDNFDEIEDLINRTIADSERWLDDYLESLE